MTKRMRLLLAGVAAVLLAFIPGSAGADTASVADHGPLGCDDTGAEAPLSLS